MDKYFKFKKVKQSVIMRLISIDENGNCELEHCQYEGLKYKANIKDLEEYDLKKSMQERMLLLSKARWKKCLGDMLLS